MVVEFRKALTLENDTNDPLLLHGGTLLIDLSKYRDVFGLFESSSSQLIEQGINSFDRELTFFDGRPSGNLVIAHSSEIA